MSKRGYTPPELNLDHLLAMRSALRIERVVSRTAGYTESTGLGADRLTAAGRARAAPLRSESE